jgi:solute carrier family 30 (zinc transporter), member 2
VAGFLVGAIALVLTSRDATQRYSFGFGRAEVLGALLSLSIVWVMPLYLPISPLHLPYISPASAYIASA